MLLPVIAIVDEIDAARVSMSTVRKLSCRFVVVQRKSCRLRHLTDTLIAGGNRTPGSVRATAGSSGGMRCRRRFGRRRIKCGGRGGRGS